MWAHSWCIMGYINSWLWCLHVHKPFYLRLRSTRITACGDWEKTFQMWSDFKVLFTVGRYGEPLKWGLRALCSRQFSFDIVPSATRLFRSQKYERLCWFKARDVASGVSTSWCAIWLRCSKSPINSICLRSTLTHGCMAFWLKNLFVQSQIALPLPVYMQTCIKGHFKGIKLS